MDRKRVLFLDNTRNSRAMPSPKRTRQSFNQKRRRQQRPGGPFNFSQNSAEYDDDFQQPPEVKWTADIPKVQKRTPKSSNSPQKKEDTKAPAKSSERMIAGAGDDDTEHFQATSSKTKPRNNSRKRPQEDQEVPRDTAAAANKKRRVQSDNGKSGKSSKESTSNESTQENADHQEKDEEIPSLLPKRRKRNRVSNGSTLEEIMADITKKKQEIDKIASGTKDKLPKKNKNKKRGTFRREGSPMWKTKVTDPKT